MKNKISKKALMTMLALSIGTSAQANINKDFSLQETDTEVSEVEVVCASGSGGRGRCKLRGGNTKIPRRLKTNLDGLIFYKPIQRLHVVHSQSEPTNKNGIQLDLQADLNNVDYKISTSKQVIESDSNLVKLLLEVRNNNDEEFGIVALNTDANGDPLEPEVKIKTRRVKQNKNGVFTSGVTKITYPRTVILPIDEFEEFVQAYEESGTELTFEDAEENGSVKATCRFNKIPTVEVNNEGEEG